jgi:hypothetical protein
MDIQLGLILSAVGSLFAVVSTVAGFALMDSSKPGGDWFHRRRLRGY